MPYSGGVYSFPSSPGAFNPATAGGTADPTSWNALIADLKTALSTCLLRDGTQSVTANIPLNTNRLTGVGNAIALQDAATAIQVQNNSVRYAADTGAADAYVITLAPAITAYVVGQVFAFLVANTNATSTPTLAVNGLTAGTIKNVDSTAVGIGALPANGVVQVAVAAVAAGTPTFHLQSGASPAITTTKQIVNTITGTVATGTTTIPYIDSIPQNTNGDQYMSLSITPKSATSTLVIDVVFNGSCSAGQNMTVALFQDSTANALAAVSEAPALNNNLTTIFLRYEMTSGTTSSTTFKVRAGMNTSATLTFNGSSGGRIFGGVCASSITITEIG